MKKILIADESPQATRTLFKVLSAHGSLFKIFTAKGGQDALDIINGEKIDLLITELNLPGMNGIALIKSLLKSKHNIPIIVMTAYGTPEIELKLNAVPIIKYFSKPVKTEAVIDAIFQKLQIPYGQVDGVSITSFLQLLEMEGKTCTLSVIATQEDKTGTLYFMDGALIAAETEELKNEAAAYEIISWDDVKIHIAYSVSRKEQKITQSLMNILMEGAKLKDDKEAQKPLIKSDETADNDTVKEKFDVFDEITLHEIPTGETQPPQLEGSPEKITAEQLMQTDPMATTLRNMKDALVKIMGPISEIVFTDALNLWIETGQPSQSSIPGLLDILDKEINDSEKSAKYRAMIDSLTNDN